ncbi:MAG TPA: DUF5916 domain-containing protein, partial [Candidatus Acidoferrum sp.]|nr:DUF5916 domain-containing protein [Candidatus Acidoferrum sp.]
MASPACPTSSCDPALLERRLLSAARVDGAAPVAIDGRLDERVWSEAPVATGFIQSTPQPAAPASLVSEARVLVDDQAVYVGLRYADPDAAGIRAPLARRDDETTADWAFVEIDTRHDRRSSFSFGVNPRGVQVDGLWMSDIDWDASWNAVWESAAQRDEKGWTAEFRIPFSQLAFSLPRGAAQLTWGINFYRHSPGHGETSNWSPRFRGLRGIVSNFNDIVVPAPRAVAHFDVTPYVAPRLDDDRDGTLRASLRAGGDLRVGLGSSFNLTATALPDFGQVEADPSQVNLSAFELFQPERRPFFLEGLDVFRLSTGLAFVTRDLSFADEAPFYSRRIGRPPPGPVPAGATDVSVPRETTLLGAAKLVGQTASGWTLGMFSGLTDDEHARVHLAGDDRAMDWPVEAR